jgi:hypothetical protein
MKIDRGLLQIGDDILSLEDLLVDIGGDISEEQVDEAITAWLEENRHNLEGKLDGYRALIRNAIDRAKLRRERSRGLADLAKTDENLADRLKKRLLWFLENYGMADRKFKLPGGNLYVAKNGGLQPLDWNEVSRPEPATLVGTEHEHLVRITVEWDEAEVRRHLDEGGTLPWVRLGERGKHLRVT